MTIIIECDTTEYYAVPEKENKTTVFSIRDNAVVISTMNETDEVLYQTEISIEDMRRIAQIILNQ